MKKAIKQEKHNKFCKNYRKNPTNAGCVCHYQEPTNMKNKVEILEYWNKIDKVYEKMLGSEYDKKMRGEKYEVFIRANSPPWVIFGEELEEAPWLMTKKFMSYKEFKNTYGEIKLTP